MKELLESFCESNDHQIELSQPFWDGIFVYATNRNAVIRIVDDDNVFGFPKVKKGSWVHRRLVEFFKELLNAPKVFEVDFDKLREEDHMIPAVKVITKECSKCEGSGVYDCEECGTELACDLCDGDGDIEKEVPADGLMVDKEAVLIYGKSHFRLELLLLAKKVAQNIGVEKVNVYALTNESPHMFDFGDKVKVLLMPARPLIEDEKYDPHKYC